MGIYPDEVTTFAAVVLYGAPVARAVLSYLLGCINGAIATSHIFYHIRRRPPPWQRQRGAHSYRNYGAKCAPMVIVFDMLKAVGAVYCGQLFPGLSSRLGPPQASISARCSASSAICFPGVLRLQGRQGRFCAAARCCCCSTGASRVVGWGAFVVLWLTTRYVSLGSVAAAVSLPFTTYFVFHNTACTVLGTCISLLVLWAHRSNIKRLLSGTESEFHFHVNAHQAGGGRMNIVVLGSGGWDTRPPRCCYRTTAIPSALWSHDPKKAELLDKTRENPLLKGVRVPERHRRHARVSGAPKCGDGGPFRRRRGLHCAPLRIEAAPRT